MLLVAACSSTSVTPSAVTSGVPNPPTSTPVQATCESIDLRTPAGSAVDLTGTWQGPARLLLVRQFGRCVWWEELSAFVADEPPGYHYRRLFQGELLSDFTIVGRFGDVYTRTSPSIYAHPPPREGSATYRIEFEGEGGAETILLSGPYLEAVSAGVTNSRWTKTSDSTELP